MNKTNIKGLLFSLAVGMIAFCGCTKDEDSTGNEVKVESLVLDKSEVTISAGELLELVATASPKLKDEEGKPAVKWSCEPANALEFDVSTASSYKCMAVAKRGFSGEATVTATCGEGENVKSATCNVTVKSGKITLEVEGKYFLVGQEVKFVVSPADEPIESWDFYFFDDAIKADYELNDGVLVVKDITSSKQPMGVVEAEADMKVTTNAGYTAYKSVNIVNWMPAADCNGVVTQRGNGKAAELDLMIYDYDGVYTDVSRYGMSVEYELLSDCNGNVTLEPLASDPNAVTIKIVRNSVSRFQTLKVKATVGAVSKVFEYTITD